MAKDTVRRGSVRNEGSRSSTLTRGGEKGGAEGDDVSVGGFSTNTEDATLQEAYMDFVSHMM